MDYTATGGIGLTTSVTPKRTWHFTIREINNGYVVTSDSYDGRSETYHETIQHVADSLTHKLKNK